MLRINCDGATYGRRFELRVADFLVDDAGTAASPLASQDGIYEFGEMCNVARVALRNKDGADRMPSPRDQRVRVRVEGNRWVQPTGDDVFHSGSINAGYTRCGRGWGQTGRVAGSIRVLAWRSEYTRNRQQKHIPTRAQIKSHTQQN